MKKQFRILAAALALCLSLLCCPAAFAAVAFFNVSVLLVIASCAAVGLAAERSDESLNFRTLHGIVWRVPLRLDVDLAEAEHVLVDHSIDPAVVS